MAIKLKISKKKLYEDEQPAVNDTNTSADTSATSDNTVDTTVSLDSADNTLDEQNNTTDNNATENTNNGGITKVLYVGTENPEVEMAYDNAVKAEHAKDIVLSCMLFKVNMTTNFIKDVVFPTAPTHMRSLMVSTHMPDKFQNIYGSYDNNPLATITAAEDLAEKYFAPLKVEEKTNESYSMYQISSVLNEGVFDRGLAIGSLFSKIVAGVGLFGAGAVTGAAPVIAGAKALGAATVAANADHGNYPTNDKALHVDYDESKENSKSDQDEIHSAINNYVNNLLIILEQGLQHITSGAGSKSISDFSDVVIDALNNRSKEMVDQFMEDNNTRLEKSKKKQLEKYKKKADNFKLVQTRLADWVAANGDKENITMADFTGFLANSNEGSPESKQKLAKVQKEIEKRYGAEENLWDSIHISYNNPLNEDLDTDSDVVFDADAMYSEFQRLFRTHMNQILNSKPEDWDIVKKAREQMVALRDGASEEIKKSIDLVCRMANSEQMGLGAKMNAFVRKHPMRQAKLTGLWKRHETDLNNRIEQRIKQISELDGKGPLRMAKEFYRNTIPNLLAMMIVYKTLYTMYNNEKLVNPNIVLGNKDTLKNLEEQLTLKKDVFPDSIAQKFSALSEKLNKEGKKTYDHTTNKFTEAPMDYLYIFVNNLIGANEYNQSTMLAAETLSKDLDKYVQEKKPNEFFSRLTDFFITTCGITKATEALMKVYNTLSMLNKDDINALTEIAVADVNSLSNNAVAPIILGYIELTQGDFIDRYLNTPNIIIKEDEKAKSIKAAKETYGIDKVQLADHIEQYTSTFNKASGYFHNIQEGKTTNNLILYMRIYIELGLYKLSKISMNPFKIMASFINMCNNDTFKTMFSSTANIQQYTIISDAWQKREEQNSWDDYIKTLTDDQQIISNLSIKGLSLSDEVQFRSLRNKLVDVEKATSGGGKIMDTDYLNNEEYKDISKPGGLSTWKDITSQIITNLNYTDINVIMNLSSDNLETTTFGDNAIPLLKSALLYMVQIAISRYSQNRDDTNTLTNLWLHGKILHGDGTNTLQVIFDDLKNNINLTTNSHAVNKLYNSIVTQVDDDFRSTLPSNLNKVTGNFFNLMLYGDGKDAELKDGNDITNLLGKTLQLDGKPLSEDTKLLNDYIIALCKYIENYKEHKPLYKLLILSSKKMLEHPDVVLDRIMGPNGIPESVFYFGLQSYQLITEDNEALKNYKTLEDYLNTPEGAEWMEAFIDELSQKLTDNNDSNSISIDSKNVEDAKIIKDGDTKAQSISSSQR